MAVNQEAYHRIKAELDEKGITLVVVTKTKPIADIQELYNMGHRDFGENYVQELVEKATHLPTDIRWHFIGHLQSNKVKHITGFVQLIHGVDSLTLLSVINKEGAKAGRVIDCLLQVHISDEETKFGLNEQELEAFADLSEDNRNHIRIIGLMGMGSFTDNTDKLRTEFRNLKALFDRMAKIKGQHAAFTVLSMGMSGDYKIAIGEGSTLVRIGSLLLGERGH